MKYGLSFFIFWSLQSLATQPLIIGHRGACGYKPEHTLVSYQLAIDMKADYVEPDLVITKDGILVARHENEISETTDVAKKFPDRKTTKKIDGREITGWFVEDFTLKEIKTLRAKERLASRDHSEDFKHEIPTFREIIELVKKESQKNKRTIGIYPELKHPSYFKSIGLPLEKPLITELEKQGLNKKDAAVFIQCFELTALKELKKSTPLPLIFLIGDPGEIPYDHILAKDKRTYLDLLNPEEFKKMKSYVTGIGPHKDYIFPVDTNGKVKAVTPLIKLAHDAGLKVHAYTFRGDKEFLAKEYNGNSENEYHRFFAADVDGVFSDSPDQAVKALETFNALKKAKSK